MLGRIAMTAIVTDAHYRMSVSLIRDLSDRGVRVVACEKASIKNPVGFASRGVLRCVRLPEEGYLDALLALCREILAQEGEKPALLPVGAKTLALLSEHRERFSPVAGLCIATPTQLALLNDKAAVSSLAQKLSVPVPENFERKSGEDLDAFFCPGAASVRGKAPLRRNIRPHCRAALPHLPHKRRPCRKHSLIFRPSHKKTPSCRNISRARPSAARFWQRTARCTGRSATTGCANTPSRAGLRAAARAFRGRIYVRLRRKNCVGNRLFRPCDVRVQMRCRRRAPAPGN